MGRFFWICFFGALGTGTRYLVGLWAAERLGVWFPFGTLLVNVAGCFLIAAIMHVALHASGFSPDLRLMLTTGFMGGLTTYSSFNYETLRLWTQGATGTAVANFAITSVGCILAGLLGSLVGQSLLRF